MNTRFQRIGTREGYDRWSHSYDDTRSGLIALDRRETSKVLGLEPGERVLDAGCGTGAHLAALRGLGAEVVGVDFSAGMLSVARAANPRSSLLQADLNRSLPLAPSSFDLYLSTLVSEHLADLQAFFAEAARVLRGGGRLVFSAFHPEMAAAGHEARFEQAGVEYRLGAELYSVEDYLEAVRRSGFESIDWREHVIDEDVVREVPSTEERLGQRLLLLILARRPGVGGHR